jgi:hypothetical protein
MEDIGSLIFYVLLGIVALIGSVQGKNKKKGTLPRNMPQRKPAATETRTSARPSPAAPAETRTSARPSPAAPTVTMPVQQRPQYMAVEPSMEGRYENPLAGAFSDEGSMRNPLADAFSDEGSIVNSMATAFSGEGSVAGSMAEAFATEGSSSLFDSGMKEFVHNEISNSEIGDAPAFDYDASPGSEILSHGFDLKKAVIYSAFLNRKEYSY